MSRNTPYDYKAAECSLDWKMSLDKIDKGKPSDLNSLIYWEFGNTTSIQHIKAVLKQPMLNTACQNKSK